MILGSETMNRMLKEVYSKDRADFYLMMFEIHLSDGVLGNQDSYERIMEILNDISNAKKLLDGNCGGYIP